MKLLLLLVSLCGCGPDLPDTPDAGVAVMKSNHDGECLTSEPTK